MVTVLNLLSLLKASSTRTLPRIVSTHRGRNTRKASSHSCTGIGRKLTSDSNPSPAVAAVVVVQVELESDVVLKLSIDRTNYTRNASNKQSLVSELRG